MRDPQRLDYLYKEIAAIHKEYLPDMRIGQLMMNFFSWYANNKGTDPFYTEDNKITEDILTFAKDITGH